MMKAKIIIFSVISYLLFNVSIFVSGLLPFISKYRMDISADKIMGYFLDIVIHPIQNINQQVNDNNPLIYCTFIASIVLIIYMIIKTRTKDYDIVGETYGVQGSARWSKPIEVMKREKEVLTIPIEDLNKDIQESMKHGGVENV
ncbi:hypothetical protein H9S87_18550 (plasmid) [Bacillus pumilus]|uniref:hypothetical protein n=1 Tax=Bacillus pumilus TaxID=1408 RepID=UPI0016586F95|nr:hypothetical protein [Bacillus pumilus]QNP18285.1 hypothetical protein H9S87_18550 [Bacillus pumilus]